MHDPFLSRIEPTRLPTGELVLPSTYDLSFEGFTPEAFALLERLRQHPHIEQYRKEKEGVRQFLREPFKRYRDDLVINWVLPNRLDFETEKNVFSRILMNDFGGGGSHHHYWLSFYRPGRTRLKDAQLVHSLWPDHFTVGLFIGGYMRELLRQAKARIAQEPSRFLEILNPLLQSKKTLVYYCGAGEKRQRFVHTAPLNEVPDGLAKATALWVRTEFPREAVLQWQGDLVQHALEAIHALWPLYRFLLKVEASDQSENFVG